MPHVDAAAYNAAPKKSKEKSKERLTKTTSRQVHPVRIHDRYKTSMETRKEIQQGLTGHLPQKIEKQFSNQNGKQASSDEENANTIHLHFSKICYRSDVPVDPTVFGEIEPLTMDEEMWTGLESSPVKDEIRMAIAKMKNYKAAGVTGVTSDMLKLLIH
jgi:hypothetical protein